MNARFELTRDDSDRIRFRLVDSEGRALLTGNPTNGKIAAQTEVLHARASIREERFLQQDTGGTHFVVLQDKDGSDLARSPKVTNPAALHALIAAIQECGTTGAIIDHTKKPRARNAS